jgi:hypothetical protein
MLFEAFAIYVPSMHKTHGKTNVLFIGSGKYTR